MQNKILHLVVTALLFSFSCAVAQEKNDTVISKRKHEKHVPLTPYHKNVIKFNPTPMLLFGEVKNITLSYERLITKNMSVALQAGYLLFPRLVDDTIARLVSLTSREKYGVNLAFDYRYYPFPRNRRPAPDGLYIGGYLSYYGFRFKNNFDILHTSLDQKGSLEGRLNVVNLGVSLGYQFVFWKRLTLDMLLFGPSLSYYNGSLEIKGNLDQEAIKDINQETVQKLLARFPALKTLFSEDGLRFTGNRTQTSIGFRYSLQLGFHF